MIESIKLDITANQPIRLRFPLHGARLFQSGT
jgi:hypothetical protein